MLASNWNNKIYKKKINLNFFLSVNLLNPNDDIKNTQDIKELQDSKLSSIKSVIDNYVLTNKHSQTLNLKLLKELVGLLRQWKMLFMINLIYFILKRKLNEENVHEMNMISTPDVVITLQISQALNAKSKVTN